MTDNLDNPQSRRIAEEIIEAREEKTAMAFLRYAEIIGPALMGEILDAGERHKLDGLKGITVPADDGSHWITVGKEVSFKVYEDGPYVLPVDTARGINDVLILATPEV